MKKKLLIYFAFIVGLLLWGGNVYASNSIEAYMNNRDNQFISTGYRVAFEGQQTFIIDLYGETALENYFVLTMCTDSNNIVSWSGIPSTEEFNIYTTKVSCMFPNSSYTGGHITYIYGSTSWNEWNNCSVSLQNCDYTFNVNYQQPNQSSWALLYSSLSSTPFSIDYATDSLMNQNQIIIDSQGRIESGLLNTYNNITNQATNIINNNNNNTQQIIDSNSEINNSINEQTQWQQEDFDVDISQVNAVTDLISTGDKNQIRDLLMFPARILMIVGGHISSNHCDSFNLGSLYGANLVLPCINWKQYVGNDLYNTIDIILSIGIYIGLIIYIRKLLDYVFSLGQTGFNSVNVEVFN